MSFRFCRHYGWRAACMTIAAGAALSLTTQASDEMSEKPQLIPREVLFGNPDRASPRLSPNGEHLAFLAPDEGVLNVWVAPAGQPDKAEAVTRDRDRGIRTYFWAYDNDHIIYLQDKKGDENWRVYSVSVDTKKVHDLTPVEGVQARVQEVSHKSPEEILIGLNDRVPQLHDIYRVNIRTGEREEVIENPGYLGFVTDDDFDVRFAQRMTPEGGIEYFQRDDGDWKLFIRIPQEDTLTTGIIGFDKSGETLYMTDSRERNTAALSSLDLRTGKQRVIAENPRADVSDVMAHPVEKTIEAVSFEYDRETWEFFDPAVKADFEYLRTVAKGDISVVSRTLDDGRWIVAFTQDDGPVRYYQYNRRDKHATFLFTNRTDLEGLPLAKMHPVVITARDGMKLVSYLTLPPWADPDGDMKPAKPLPTVLLVHGGPWARDSWGYDPMHQWLANRGYAVLSVNFRGSTGFGKRFINAGDREWGKKMHDDLLDAVKWAVRQGATAEEQVAIMGGSYGGYATLVGLTFTPDVFACGVDIVGPSNLITLLDSIPEYWVPLLEMFASRVGDHRTEAGQALLKSRSPLTHVDRIQRPLLIGQGANDPRVKQAESDQIVQAMEAKDIPVTYVLFPDEGHGFAKPENRLAFFAVTEAFLAEHLGGRYQPIGEAFEGSSVQVPHGAQYVPNLQSALD